MLDFMIIGAQKAATSSLHAALRRTPGVYLPSGETTFFEDPDYAGGLWKTFKVPTGKPVLGIKRPSALCDEQIIDRVSAALPTLKYIAVLRDPVSRAVSAYYHLMRHAHLPVRPLNEGIARCFESFQTGESSPSASIISYGLYGDYLRKWYDRNDPKRFLILSHKAVTTHPISAVTACLLHLGLPSNIAPAAVIERQNVGLYQSKLIHLAHFGSLLETRPILDGKRRIARENRFIGAAGKLLSSAATLLGSYTSRAPETLSAQNQNRLFRIYQADREIMLGLLPRDIVYWDYQTNS